jgi:hypothetical protein
VEAAVAVLDDDLLAGKGVDRIQLRAPRALQAVRGVPERPAVQLHGQAVAQLLLGHDRRGVALVVVADDVDHRHAALPRPREQPLQAGRHRLDEAEGRAHPAEEALVVAEVVLHVHGENRGVLRGDLRLERREQIELASHPCPRGVRAWLLVRFRPAEDSRPPQFWQSRPCSAPRRRAQRSRAAAAFWPFVPSFSP